MKKQINQEFTYLQHVVAFWSKTSERETHKQNHRQSQNKSNMYVNPKGTVLCVRGENLERMPEIF